MFSRGSLLGKVFKNPSKKSFGSKYVPELQYRSSLFFKNFFHLLFGRIRKNKSEPTFIEEYPYEKGFSNHYKENVKPLAQKYEKLRVDALEKSSFLLRISILGILILLTLIISFIIANETSEEAIEGIVQLMALLTVGIIYYSSKPLAKYKKSIKEEVFPKILSFIPNTKYNIEYKGTVNSLIRSEIIPSFDVEKNEDHITTKHKGVEINLFDSKLYLRVRTKNGTRLQKIFNGLFIEFSMNKNFNGQTILTKSAKKGFFSKYLSLRDDLKEVKLEDPEFRKIFKTYSTDQVEARYLLTTAIMQRFLDLSKLDKKSQIECSFYDNKLLIKISTKKDMFEPGPIKNPEDFIDDSKLLLREIKTIYEIVNILKLDQNIGL